ncbi:hypothetical protein D918_04164 [Trichuris suis]|nr:hypothetical protein D918_04164 [Trichuris suis]
MSPANVVLAKMMSYYVKLRSNFSVLAAPTPVEAEEEEKSSLVVNKSDSTVPIVSAATVPFSFTLKSEKPTSTLFSLPQPIAQSTPNVLFAVPHTTSQPITFSFTIPQAPVAPKPPDAPVDEQKPPLNVPGELQEVQSPKKEVIVTSAVVCSLETSVDEVQRSPRKDYGVVPPAADELITQAGESPKVKPPLRKEDTVVPTVVDEIMPPARESPEVNKSLRGEDVIVSTVTDELAIHGFANFLMTSLFLRQAAGKQPDNVREQLATTSEVPPTSSRKEKRYITKRELLRLIRPHMLLNALLNSAVDSSLRRIGSTVLQVDSLVFNTKLERLQHRLFVNRLRRCFLHWRTWARHKAREKSGIQFPYRRIGSPTESVEHQKLLESVMASYRQRMERMFESWTPLNLESSCRTLVGQSSAMNILIREACLKFFLWRCALLLHPEASTSLIAHWALVQLGLLSCDEIVYYANCPESRAIGVINNYVAGRNGNMDVSPDCIILAMDIADDFSKMAQKLQLFVSTCAHPVQLLVIVSYDADQPLPEEMYITSALGLADDKYRGRYFSVCRLIFSRSDRDFSEERIVLGEEICGLVKQPVSNCCYELLREYSLVCAAFQYFDNLFEVPPVFVMGLCYEVLCALLDLADVLDDVGKIISPLVLQFIGIRQDRLLSRNSFRATIASWLPTGSLGKAVFSSERVFDKNLLHELNCNNVDENSKWVIISTECGKRMCDHLQQLRLSALNVAAELRRAEKESMRQQMEERLRSESVQVQSDASDILTSQSRADAQAAAEEEEIANLFKEYYRKIDELTEMVSNCLRR